MDNEQADFQLMSIGWYVNEAEKLIKEYTECKTEHDRQRLLPKLKHIHNKLSFEDREMFKTFGGIEEIKATLNEIENGEKWK